jgi:transposase
MAFESPRGPDSAVPSGPRAAAPLAGSPARPVPHLAQVPAPDQVIRHVPDRCQGCGAELAGAEVEGGEARQVFDLPRPRLLVREHRAERRRCTCGTTTQPAFPAEARAAACYGPGAGAVLLFAGAPASAGGPAGATAGRDAGAPLATGTVAAVLAEGAAGLEGFCQVVREQLATSQAMERSTICPRTPSYVVRRTADV